MCSTYHLNVVVICDKIFEIPPRIEVLQRGHKNVTDRQTDIQGKNSVSTNKWEIVVFLHQRQFLNTAISPLTPTYRHSCNKVLQ